MKASKPVAFILLAFVIGATISQGAFAFADDSSTNPFRAIWDAISELQVKTDSLQSQIEDLRTQQGVTTASADQPITRTSDVSLEIEVAGGDSGQTLVTLIARNAGPDNAVGVKLTAFYQTSLFRVNFIQGADCIDGSRGIIECYLGTIVAGSEARVTIDATPISLGQQAIITADLSSITTDANLADNRAEVVFVTSVVPAVQQPAPSSAPPVETPAEQPQVEQPVPEQTEQEDIEETESPESSEQQASEQSQESEQTSEQEADGSSEQEATEGSSEESGDTGETAGNEGESTNDSSAGESSSDAGSQNESSAGDGSAGDAGTGSEGESTGDTGTGESGGETGAGEGSSDGGAESSGDTGSADTGSEGGSSGESGSTD